MLEGAIGAGAGGVVALLVRWAYDAWRHRRRKLHQADIIDRVYGHLSQLVATTPASRALVAAAHNGGGRPRVGTPISASIAHEVYAEPYREPVRDTWQNVQLDDHHLRLLARVASREDVVLDAEHVQSDRLRRFYRTSEVAQVRIVWLADHNERWLYLVLHAPISRDWDDVELEALAAQATRLRGLLTEDKRR